MLYATPLAALILPNGFNIYPYLNQLLVSFSTVKELSLLFFLPSTLPPFLLHSMCDSEAIWTHGFFLHSMHSLITDSINFDAQRVSSLARRNSFRLVPCPFDTLPSFFEYFHTFWRNKMFQDHLVPSLPQLWNKPFSKESWFFFRNQVFRSQDLGVGYSPHLEGRDRRIYRWIGCRV